MATPNITLDALNALNTKQQNNTQFQEAIKFETLEQNKPYKLVSWKQIEFDIEGTTQTSFIGMLEDNTEFWMPKSLHRKIKNEDPPHVFVYKGREHDGWKTYKTDVWLGSVLRANGML